MSTALRVVHQGLDAANNGGVYAALRRLIVHAAQEVEEAGEAIQLNKACDKPDGDKENNEDGFRQVLDVSTILMDS